MNWSLVTLFSRILKQSFLDRRMGSENYDLSYNYGKNLWGKNLEFLLAMERVLVK